MNVLMNLGAGWRENLDRRDPFHGKTLHVVFLLFILKGFKTPRK